MTRRKEAGQALVFAALGMTVFLGFAGLAVDMGILRYDRRLQQSAADAAALAGASNLASASGGVTVGAQAASAQDGFTDNSGGSTCTTVGCVTVTVNYSGSACGGPCAGPHTGNANYVEVLVTTVQPTLFMKALNIPKQTVVARAVATNVSGANTTGGCLYTLGSPTSAIEGVGLNGNATLNGNNNCGIVDNGNYDPTGNALSISAGTFGVSGSCSGSGCGKGSVTCALTPNSCPTYGTPAGADPLASITPPSQPAASLSCPSKGTCDVSTSGTQTLQPGTYDSITIGKNSVVTLASGIYYINGSGGMQFNGGGTVTSAAGGVLIYFTGSATINAVGGGNKTDNVNLQPLTSGPYAGVLFYQDRNDTASPTLGGDDGSIFGGVAYFPSVELTFFGNATNTAGIVIAKAFNLSGHPTINLTGGASLPPGATILENAVLVE